MNCKKCGNKINNNDIFCPMCGTKVEDDKSIFNKNDNINEVDKDKINYKPKNTTPYVAISLIGLFGAIITTLIYNKNSNYLIFFVIFMFSTITGYMESSNNIKHNCEDKNYSVLAFLLILLVIFFVVCILGLIILLIACAYVSFTCSGMGMG